MSCVWRSLALKRVHPSQALIEVLAELDKAQTEGVYPRAQLEHIQATHAVLAFTDVCLSKAQRIG